MGRKLGPRRNRELTNAQRKVICLHKDATSITNRELSQWATEKFSFPVSEMTISRTLKRRDQWVSDNAMPDGKRARKLVCPEVEDATYAWFLATKDKGGPLTDALICEAAKTFYASLKHDSGSKQLVFSHGWVGRFKKRHGIKGYINHLQIGTPINDHRAADTLEEVLHQIDAVKSIIADYELGDVFYMEGTALLFAWEPVKTLATKRIFTTKRSHEKITVGFTANLDGSIKLPPLVIDKYKRPQAFISRNVLNPLNLGILWHANHLACMTIEIFEDYILGFEKRMLLAGKSKVLLLIDMKYSKFIANVEKNLKVAVVKFLPNSSGLYGSVDAGITGFIKACYRKYLLKHQIDCILSGKGPSVDIYDAVGFLEKSWRVHVTPTVISNGWRHMYLSRKKLQLFDNLNNSPEAKGGCPRHSFEMNEQLTEISELLEQLGSFSTSSDIAPNMSAEEFVQIEELNGLATTYEPMEAEIWEVPQSIEAEEDADFPVSVVPPVTYSTVRESLNNIGTYLLQQPEDVVDMLQNLRSLEANLASHHARMGRQRDIARLFITDK